MTQAPDQPDPSDPAPTPTAADPSPGHPGRPERPEFALDRWSAEHFANPRFLPYFAWLVLALVLVGAASSPVVGQPWAPPIAYALACAAVGWLLWRNRRLPPELTLRFHWLAVVTGVGLLIAWLVLGWLSVGELPERLAALRKGQLLGTVDPAAEPHDIQASYAHSPALFWTRLHLRFVGMVLLVPMLEELFIRSLCLRMCSNAKKTGLGLLQVLEDLPLVGDVFIGSKLTAKAADAGPVFAQQFHQTPLGRVTLFGVFSSTLIFTLGHRPVDYLGCVACGVVWCWLVWFTNRPSLPPEKRLGLGPVVWSHAITNALLWWYSWGTGDWQFL